MLISITLENKDRLSLVWPVVRRHLEWLLSAKFGRCPVLVERAVVRCFLTSQRSLILVRIYSSKNFKQRFELLTFYRSDKNYIKIKFLSNSYNDFIGFRQFKKKKKTKYSGWFIACGESQSVPRQHGCRRRSAVAVSVAASLAQGPVRVLEANRLWTARPAPNECSKRPQEGALGSALRSA